VTLMRPHPTCRAARGQTRVPRTRRYPSALAARLGPISLLGLLQAADPLRCLVQAHPGSEGAPVDVSHMPSWDDPTRSWRALRGALKPAADVALAQLIRTSSIALSVDDGGAGLVTAAGAPRLTASTDPALLVGALAERTIAAMAGTSEFRRVLRYVQATTLGAAQEAQVE
jgi:hypothetical protein